MESVKVGTNIFQILYKSFLIYIKNFLSLTRVMLFPAFGQLLGIILIFVPNYYFIHKFIPSLSQQTIQQNIFLLLFAVLAIAIPGIGLFVKAFWEYLVAMVSLNTMAKDMEDNKNFGDFKAHNKAVTDRTKDYVILLLILTLISLAFVIFPYFALLFQGQSKLLFPLFFLISIIGNIFISVKLCLSYQAFAFEKISATEIIKRSWNLTKNNFWRIVVMGLILYIAVAIISDIISFIAGSAGVTNLMAVPIGKYLNLFENNNIFLKFLEDSRLTIQELSLTISAMTIKSIFAFFLLPLQSACFTLLYFDILERKNADV